MIKNGKPVLYKCPYCAKGRFTEDDGWDVATKHVKSHQRGPRKKKKREVDFDSPRGGWSATIELEMGLD